MDLFEKFSAVSVSAGSRISDLDRFFCEQHQAAYHAAKIGAFGAALHLGGC